MSLQTHIYTNVVAEIQCAGCGDIEDYHSTSEEEAEWNVLRRAKTDGWQEINKKNRGVPNVSTMPMKTVKRKDGWWITDTPEGEDFGPYDTKDKADDDREGVERFYKYKDKPGFITTENKRGVGK